MAVWKKLVERGVFDSPEHAANEIDLLCDSEVMKAVFDELERDAQGMVLGAALTDDAARSAAVAEWRAIRNVRDKLKREAGHARRQAEKGAEE